MLLAARTGISERQLLKWINMADLFRVHGVATQYAELLERAGLDTVNELAQRNPESLHEKMTETNAVNPVVRQVPPLKIIHSWTSEAKTLPKKITR